MNIGISGCRNDEARDVTGLGTACETENKGLRGVQGEGGSGQDKAQVSARGNQSIHWGRSWRRPVCLCIKMKEERSGRQR